MTQRLDCVIPTLHEHDWMIICSGVSLRFDAHSNWVKRKDGGESERDEADSFFLSSTEIPEQVALSYVTDSSSLRAYRKRPVRLEAADVGGGR